MRCRVLGQVHEFSRAVRDRARRKVGSTRLLAARFARQLRATIIVRLLRAPRAPLRRGRRGLRAAPQRNFGERGQEEGRLPPPGHVPASAPQPGDRVARAAEFDGDNKAKEGGRALPLMSTTTTTTALDHRDGRGRGPRSTATSVAAHEEKSMPVVWPSSISSFGGVRCTVPASVFVARLERHHGGRSTWTASCASRSWTKSWPTRGCGGARQLAQPRRGEV